MVSAVIAAKNERDRITWVIKETEKYVDEIIVVDDGSTDGTKQMAKGFGVKVVSNSGRKGYVGAIKTGFKEAKGEIVVTLDADGEHNPSDIPRLVQPILEGKADLVLGRRRKIARISERFLNWLTNLKVKVGDSGTGFRTIKSNLALELNLPGKCTCGALVLEADYYGARIAEVPIETIPTDKPRRIAWHHIGQTFYVFGLVLRKKRRL